MLVALITVVGLLWLLLFRFRERFMRAYGSFFLILLFFVLNKGGESDVNELGAGTFSPLSLARWGCLGILFVIAIRLPRPEGIRADIPLTMLVSLFLADILLSTTYAGDFSYSFMRAASFVALAVAIGAGLSTTFTGASSV